MQRNIWSDPGLGRAVLTDRFQLTNICLVSYALFPKVCRKENNTGTTDPVTGSGAEATVTSLNTPRQEMATQARRTLETFPFASCDALNPDAPIRRSDRSRRPSVRLQPIDETPARRVQVNSKPTTSTNGPSRTVPNQQTPKPRARITGPLDLDSVLTEGVAEHSALPTSSPGGEHPRAPGADSAIDRALRAISDLEVLRGSQ